MQKQYNLLMVALIGTLVLLVVVAAFGVSSHASRQAGVDPLAAAAHKSLSTLVGGDETDMAPMVSSTTGKPDETPIRLIEVPVYTTYEGGPVAYIDYSVDSLGECVVVWVPPGSFKRCEETLDWQTLYPRKVGAGVSMEHVVVNFGEVYSPENWRR